MGSISSPSADLSTFGDHFIVGITGTALAPEEREMLAELRPLGIVLFAKNIESANESGWKNSLSGLIEDARSSTGRDQFLVSIDHEGGRVHRFPKPVTKFPAARYWMDDAYTVSAAMADELRLLGFNLSYAPVADIQSEPTNQVIGDRSYGTTPEEVGYTAEAAMRGLHDRGVLSCIKHFPGHGDTKQDSHFELPYVNVEKEMLIIRELVPFRHLIAAGAPLVMTCHVRFPALDSENPASLSKAIITGMLREEIGFRHAVITDDLEMKALAEYTPAEKAIRCMEAGTDILLEANCKERHALSVAMEMAEALRTAVAQGSLDLSASRTRVRNLLRFAANLGSHETLDPARLGCSDHADLASAVGQRKPLA